MKMFVKWQGPASEKPEDKLLSFRIFSFTRKVSLHFLQRKHRLDKGAWNYLKINSETSNACLNLYMF